MEYIYLDNNSTTQVHPDVLSEIIPFFTSQYANASSNHKFGNTIESKVKDARLKVADFIGSDSSEILFTSGATEAINLAIRGVLNLTSKVKPNIITCASEHHAVLDTCKNLEDQGIEVTYLGVKSDGRIDLNELEKALNENTVLVSIMLANNETGVFQPINEIAQISKKKGVPVMTDATQAVGKIPVNVEHLGIDLMAFSGHKFYAPKGIGVLYVRKGLRLSPLLYGGGHEQGLRSGTLNVPGIIGIGEACEIASRDMNSVMSNVGELRDRIEKKLIGKLPEISVNGHKDLRMHNVTNLCFPGIETDALISGLKKTIISNGSACTSTVIEPSHVLKAMGLTDNQANSSIRISIGRFNTIEQIDEAIDEILSVITKLKIME